MHTVTTCTSFPEPPRQASHCSTEGWVGSSSLQKLCLSLRSQRLLCPLWLRMRLCVLHTPSPHALCGNLLKASPSLWLCWSFKQAILTSSLTHTHTLSPKEEIKNQMTSTWGSISQTSSQEPSVRLSSKLSNLQLQWKYYTCSSLKLYVFTWWPHMKSVMVTHGHQAMAVLKDALFTSTILWAFYCQETGMRSTGGEQSVYIRGKTSLSLPGAQALHANGLGSPMVFVHFLVALLEPNTRPFSKRALA